MKENKQWLAAKYLLAPRNTIAVRQKDEAPFLLVIQSFCLTTAASLVGENTQQGQAA